MPVRQKSNMIDSKPILMQSVGEMQITIYTDGACDHHAENRPGGWAAILRATDEHGKALKETVISGGAENTTNNQMELTAVIEGLKKLLSPSRVTIVTYSRYVIDIASEQKRKRKNAALWNAFSAASADHHIQWRYIEGHSGHLFNERCDKLAVAEKNRLVRNGDTGDRNSMPHADIQIYLSTAYSRKRKSSAYSAVVVSRQVSADKSGILPGKTELECVLVGALACLRELPADQSVTVFTAQEYLSKGMTQWLPGWNARGWKTKTGEPVKYKSHWQALWQACQQRRVAFAFVKARDDEPNFTRGKSHCVELLNSAG